MAKLSCVRGGCGYVMLFYGLVVEKIFIFGLVKV
jgi:hypothetical protein